MPSSSSGRKRSEAQAATTPPAATQPAGGGKLTTGPYANGDATAGKAVFAANSCSGCHTLKAAGATGVVGPSLDKLKESAATAGQPLGAFIAQSITDPNAYIAPGFAKGTMPGTYKTVLSSKQIADLVAFIYGSVDSEA